MSDTTKPPRPTVNDEMIRLAAAEVITSMFEQDYLDSKAGEKDDLIEELCDARKHSFGTNGYDLAKELDDRHGWSPDADIVTELDNMEYAIRQQLRLAETKWIEAYNIQPPFPIGTMVKCKWGGKEITGTIDEIDTYHPGHVLIKQDGKTARPVVRYEDLELAEASEQ